MKWCLVFLMLNMGCANYINQLHKEIDTGKPKKMTAKVVPEGETDSNRVRSPFEDPFYYATYYKGKPIKLEKDVRPINEPKSVSNSMRDNHKRHRADDFTDNSAEASLWSGKGKSRYLFSDVKSKEIGDIIVINVFESLKNRISNELKKNFGVAKPKAAIKEKPKVAENTDGKKKDDPKETKKDDAVDKDLEATNKVYDKISGLIVEEVNRDYLLVKGKKEVIFQKTAHEVGVQALISRDDITDDNQIPSDKMLETQVLILR